MNHEISAEQYFCLRNWAVCAGSLRIRLSAAFADGAPEQEITLDLTGGSSTMEGLIIYINPQTDGTGVLYLGTDPTSHTQVSQFTLTLDNASGTVRSLQLEYAFADAMDTYYNRIPWNSEPLFHDTLLFAVRGNTIAVTMQMQAQPDDTPAVRLQKDNAPDASAPAENASDNRPAFDMEDIRGDIAADLQMLLCYTGTDALETIKALRTLQEQLDTMPPEEAAAALSEQEKRLADCIERTQTDIQLYRKAFLEKL